MPRRVLAILVGERRMEVKSVELRCLAFCLAFSLLMAASLCNAASRCPDPRLRRTTIGGESIDGGVVLHKIPLKFARVRLYSSSGHSAWIGRTDKQGRFRTDKLPADEYRLAVDGWGSAAVRLEPARENGFHQKPAWNLSLTDNACISTVENVN